MTPTTPTVTAIVTFWNRASYLAEAIDSILGQELPPGDTIELLLVDDGSDDEGPAVARRYVPPARLLQQANRGAPSAANRGLREARGTYVSFCDSDDVWMPGKLVAQLAAARAGHDIVFGHVEEFLSPDLEPELARTRPLRPPMPGFIPSCALVRRSMAMEVGPFDESLVNGSWVNWYTRVRGAGLAETVVPQVVCRRRVHESNNWAAQGRQGIDYLRALRPWVHQQRGEP